MRHLRGDRKDFSRVNFISLVFLLLIIPGADLFSQLPINGFCSYRRITVPKSYEKVFTLDIDNNNLTDFLLFNSSDNKAVIQKSAQADEKNVAPVRYAPFAITDIKPVIQLKRKELLYFAISQKERKAALLSVTAGGISTRMQYKFDAYPASLAVADVNGDGNSEAIVCGNNFKGISLFIIKNRLEEYKAVNEGVYSSAFFIDLNYDGYPDIAAYESRRNSIVFFINDQNGNFRKLRNIKFDPSVKGFKTADVNSDGYMDIILMKKNGINILAGDSVSSFKKTYFVRTPVTPDEVAVDDFNGDGLNDLAFINKASGEFFVQLNKGNGSYYYPVLMLKRKSLSDIRSFRDSFLKKIVLLNPEGEVYVFSKFDSRKEPERISAFGNVSAFSAFGEGQGLRDLCIADSYQKALIIIFSEPGNPLSKYYSVRTSAAFEKVLVFDSGKNEKIFYLYSPGDNLVEVIKYNFESQKIEKYTLYVSGLIHDLKLKPSPGNTFPDIYILSQKSDPGFSVYQFKGYHYTEINSGKIQGSYVDAALSPNDTLSIVNWTRSRYGMEYNGISFSRPSSPRMLYKYDNKVQDDLELVAQALPNGTNDFLYLNLIVNGKETEGIIYEPKFVKGLNFEVKTQARPEFTEESTFIYNEGDKKKFLFIYDFRNGIFYKADLNSKSRIVTVKGTDKTEGVVKYIVEKNTGKKLRLIYSSRTDKCLNFKEIE